MNCVVSHNSFPSTKSAMMKGAYLLPTLLCALLFVVSLSYIPTSSAADACSICRWVANIIEGFVAENKTEEEITAAIAQLCSLAPSSFKAECYRFLDQEVPAIITYILNSENPGTVCGQLGFCPYNMESDEFRTSATKIKLTTKRK